MRTRCAKVASLALRWRRIGIGLLLTALGACTPGARATAPEVAAPVAKPVPRGLVAMGRIGFAFRAGEPADNSLAALQRQQDAFDGVVISAAWDTLQPAPDKLDTRSIDDALAAVAAYNAKAAKPLWVRLRIFASHRAPAWASQLGGGPAEVRGHQAGGEPLRIGRFWHPAYRQAWRELMNTLAGRYDAHPLVRGISVTSCTSRAAEPFILPLDRESIGNLRRAGFSDDAYRQCLLGAVGDYAAWKATPVDYTFNAFHRTDGRTRVDHDTTIEVMRQFRRAFGERAILMNHGLTFPPREGAKPLYAEFAALGPPVSLQMFAPDSSPWDAAILYAVRELKAGSVEIWPAVNKKFGGYESLPVGQLRGWSARLVGPTGRPAAEHH